MDVWPSPPLTPVEGDDMHLPQELIAGVHPGKGWHYNSIKCQDYYRFLIPDPAIPGCQVVTPFINFHIYPFKPQVSATYHLGLPIWTHELRAIPVDYPTPSLSPNQICLLDLTEPFMPAFNKVVQDNLSYDLIAALQQYCHYKELQYKAQGKFSELCVKGVHYLECAVEVLSDLENANIIGRIYLQYEDEIIKEIGDNTVAGCAFYEALNTWENPLAWHCTQMRDLEIKSMETNESHCSYHGWQTNYTFNKCPHVCYHKCMCYKCHKYGHIRRECPNQQVKKEKKATPRREHKVFYLNGKCRVTPWTLA
jgi:hypothetical protein